MTDFKPWPLPPEQKAKLDKLTQSLNTPTWPFPIVNGKPVEYGVDYAKRTAQD